MANLCNQCGQPLAREDSRFCNCCGSEVSPHASSSPLSRRTQTIAGQYSFPTSGTGAEGASARPVLREQIAFAPSSPSASPTAPGDAPPWLSRLDKMSAPQLSRPGPQSLSPDTPPGVVNPLSSAGRPSSPGGFRLPQRELRVKVWEGEDAGEPSEVEDLPTAQVPSVIVGEKDEQALPPAARGEQSQNDTTRTGEEDRGDADLPTRPMVAHLAVPEQVHAQRSSDRRFPAQSYRQPVPPQSLPGQVGDQQQQGFSAWGSPNASQPPNRQQPAIPATPILSPGFQQPAQASATGERAAGPVHSRPKGRKGRMRLIVVLVMLLVLLGGGLIYWLIAFQPFSVPAVTSTSLTFSNANMGIVLHYPQGWTNQLDAAHQTVSFFDANHIDQLTISVTSSNGSNTTAYVSK